MFSNKVSVCLIGMKTRPMENKEKEVGRKLDLNFQDISIQGHPIKLKPYKSIEFPFLSDKSLEKSTFREVNIARLALLN